MPFALSVGDYIHIHDIFGRTLRSGTLRSETPESVNSYTEFPNGVAYHFNDQGGPEYVEWTHWIEVPKKVKKFLVKTVSHCVYVERDFKFFLAQNGQNITNEELPDSAVRMFLREKPQYDIPNLRYVANVIRSGAMCVAQIEVLAESGFNFHDPFGVNSKI
jgi:hypothetical protein